MTRPTNLRRFSAVSLLLLFCAAGIIAYWPAFFGEKIWDDHFLVGGNPFIRSPWLAWECFQHWLYPFSVTRYFRPVQNLSYMFDYWVWGDELFGYHLTNVLIHAGAALVIANLIRRIAITLLLAGSTEKETRSATLLAWATAFVWLIHPVHHAGVAYLSGRADSLAALLAVSAWLLCERAIDSRRRTISVVCGFFAAALTLLALGAKEIAITWIVLFSLYQLFFRPGLRRSLRIGIVLSAWTLVLLYALQRQSLPQPETAAVATAAPAYGARVVQALRALGDYLSIVLCPMNLHMERKLGLDALALQTAGPWLRLHSVLLLPLGILGVVTAIYLCVHRSSHRRLHAFAVCWFLTGFLPISNLFPLNAPVAEHWIYMPSIAAILLLVKGLGSIPVPAARVRAWGYAAVCLGLLLLTHEQSRTWVSEEGFFRTSIERGGDTPRAYSNLARILESKGDLQGAETIIRTALARNPNAPVLKVQLSSVLLRQGKAEQAAQLLTETKVEGQAETKRPPIPWTPDVQRVLALLETKRDTEAASVLAEALGRWPLAWELVLLQSMLHERAGRPADAIAIVSGYVTHHWWHRPAVITLAQHLAAAGRYEEAVEKYELAAHLDIRSAKPYEQIAAIRFRQGRTGEALRAQQQAVRREPQSAEHRLKLAQLQEAAGHPAEAAQERAIAAKLPPRQ